MSKSIGILGCGWLGTPLAKSLIAKGNSIKGTTTSEHKLEFLKMKGIVPYQITLTQKKVEGDIQNFLMDLEVLIINIPPGLRKTTTGSFVKRMEKLLDCLNKSKVKHLLFVSSTSVYGNVEGEITEETIPEPITESGKQLLMVEQKLKSNQTFSTTIIRFGGLIGPNRHPINYLKGKTGLKNGEELINLIHLNDCILMIETILQHNYWGLVFNGVYPYHPTKKNYYTEEAIKRQLTPPQFLNSKEKIVKKAIECQTFYVKSHQLLTSIVS
ncbi:NAD-dependent epimerase/dehydratase family protein [Croceitalea rosinachiae]|uniref:NAD-dependent epimerase/dehydratase family protein n=1 Tax=Croceitalea rosinachiae TaxID=3075596 RepID=A0ABU3A6W5_9FLAO|nr:NAD-dependent epimerase/dehydratase family protein [Croceitalea sp. F388]MDT0605917.1 NAD-dependent epimerase/dehydratase family protein [Croceitalea sp. F388]